MCDTFTLPTEHCKAELEEFIQKNHLKDIDVYVSSGSEKGENYFGDMFKIEITSRHSKCVLFNLIVKTSPTTKVKSGLLQVEDLYNREANLYNVILPAFKTFQDQYKVPDGEQFHPVKCYKANTHLIFMEDICVKGYGLYNPFNSYDSEHLELVVISLARYHSLSFAMKEINPHAYKELAKLVEKNNIRNFLDGYIRRSFNKAISILDDPSKVKKLQSFSVNGVENYYKYINAENAAPYDIICHGDCWNNNIMFKYEDGRPVDMKFVDWQIAKCCSPIIDLSNIIYCTTDASIRAKYGRNIFNIYYDALKKQLKFFDLDIEKCYPRNVFENHLKKFLPYGLVMSIITLPAMLCNKGSEVDVNEMCDPDDNVAVEILFNEVSKARLHGVIDDFIELELI